MALLKICFLGLDNLPVLAPGFDAHGVGGEQVQHTLLARSLARRGHPISMVVYDYGQADCASWDRVVTYKAYRQHEGTPVLRFLHPRLTGVWSAMARADADVYYLSCAGMHLGLAAAFCRVHRRRVVFRVAHDADCEPDALLVTYWRDRKLYEYGLRRANAILVQSRRQQQALLQNYGLDSELAGMLVEFPEQSAGGHARDIDILWVNNLRDFKRPELFLALARRLPGLRLHMIGGPQPHWERMFIKIEIEARAIFNLVFHGRVPYQAMSGYFARARLFVNTSDSEGFPNSFLQAWARGTPVISFFDPDGLIRREGLGTAVDSFDDMLAAIRHLSTDAAAWRAASDRCQRYMQASYQEEQVLAPYLRLLGGTTESVR